MTELMYDRMNDNQRSCAMLETLIVSNSCPLHLSNVTGPGKSWSSDF